MPDKTPVSFVIIDNDHLNKNGVLYFCSLAKEFVLITSNANHPAFDVDESNLHIIRQNGPSLKEALAELKSEYGCERITIQSGGTLASSVIIVAAGSCLLPPCVIPAFGLRLHIPELLSDALLFRRFLLGLLPSVDLPLPCGQVTVVLLHKGGGVVIRPLERLYVGVTVLFEDTGQQVHPTVNFLLYT